MANKPISIEDELEIYTERYKNIFKFIKPRVINGKKAKYTEANQTANFVAAYLQLHPDAVAWFECPVVYKGNDRLDCVIYDKAQSEIIIIESKCFRRPSKYYSFFKDLQRASNEGIVEQLKEYIETDNLEKTVSSQDFGVSLVLLADIWRQEDKYNTILLWENKNFSEFAKKWKEYETEDKAIIKVQEELINNDPSFWQNLCNNFFFSQFNMGIIFFDETKSCADDKIDTYNLLYFCAKIK